ncbi:MAG TPA: transketolase [Sphaerochaeta sp.]|jgi:transketolase|nr:transketolase [Sphaerochaeta sp.]
MLISSQISKARELRVKVLTMLYNSQSGHPGGSLSCVEILMALYYNKANIKPEDPHWVDRDRIILSKGHAAPILYAILADLNYFPKADLDDFRQITSHLQGHPDMGKTPGVDVNTGSLGHGISVAGGMAKAAKYLKKEYQVFAIIGDGELQEGLCWEASMAAAHYKLDNLTLLLDYNGLQIDGSNEEVMDLGDIMKKFKAFGFSCHKVNGHNIEEIVQALDAPSDRKPKFICCETIKGKGVSFMEDQFGWHGKAPNKEQYEQAMKELGGTGNV